jgi:hypothetical protein
MIGFLEDIAERGFFVLTIPAMRASCMPSRWWNVTAA